MGLNSVIITGNLARDPELRYTQAGKAVANITLAVNRKFNRDEVDFINCVAWGKTAEIAAEYLRKGSKAGVQGSLRVSSYEKDGQKRYKTEVNVEQLEFLGKKSGNNSEDFAGESQSSFNNDDNSNADDADEFPF